MHGKEDMNADRNGSYTSDVWSRWKSARAELIPTKSAIHLITYEREL